MAGAGCGILDGVNPLAPFESSIAERYHEETKYSEAGLRRAEYREFAVRFFERCRPHLADATTGGAGGGI